MPRLKAITLAPDALDRNGISTAETIVAARLDFLINGALATGYDRDGIGKSQKPTSASAMTLDGDRGLLFQSQGGVHVLIYAAGADSGRTFTVAGTDINGAALSEDITGPGTGLIVLSAARFYTIISVTPDAATAGNIEIGTNGYINFGQAQHISTYSGGNNNGETMTFTGEDRYGNVMTETDTGPNNATVTGSKNFQKLYKVSIGTASTGAMEMGVDGTCESQWFQLNYRGRYFNTGLGVRFSSGAAMTYTVQHTFNDIQASGFVEDDAETHNHDTMVALTAKADGNYTNPPIATRLAITAHTGGEATFSIVQAG